MNHMRVLRPAEGVYAFYDGRVGGYRFAEGPNWVDEGAIALGIASYAVVSGSDALVYDTHVSVEHARFVRELLEGEGVSGFTVVLSHWHLDHVAGTEVFGDCEVISSERTAEHLARRREAIERGELEGPPAIDPLVLPTRTYSERLEIPVGDTTVELIHTDIHSDDATMVWLPAARLLLCGDTMEDTVTYVDEPESFDVHLANLERLREIGPDRILPNHGSPDLIGGGGYSIGLISATENYIRALQQMREAPGLRDASLRDLITDSIEAGWLEYFAPYEAVHRHNVETVVSG
jgi:cyclase